MKENPLFHRLSAAILSLVTASAMLGSPLAAFAGDNINYAVLAEDYYAFQPPDDGLPSYSEYYDEHCGEKYPDKEIRIKGADYTAAENGDFSAGSFGTNDDRREDTLMWSSQGGSVTYTFTAEETGIYCIEMSYLPLENTASSIELSVELDGSLPFESASRIALSKVWVNEFDIHEDSRGNQVRPPQVQQSRWCNSYFGDPDGLFSEPIFFCIEKGTHEITFTSEKAGLAIEYFRFCQPQEIPSYSEYAEDVRASVGIDDTKPNLIRIEGENAVYKSDSMLCPTSDNTSPLVSPSDPRKVMYNTIGGGGSWKKAHQSVSWKIDRSEIEYDGWYRIGIKARQDQMRGFCSDRRISLDGEVPCSELEQVSFKYDTDWQLVTPKSGDDYIYVYLTADRDHILTLEAVPGEIGGCMRRLDGIIDELGVYYREVLMITGPTPDKYTDYYVHEKIPDLVESFERLSGQLSDVQKSIEGIAGTEGSEAAAIERLTVILDKCIDKPLKIPVYLSQIKDNMTAVSSWMCDYRDQPLEIDYIELSAGGEKFTSVEEKFLSSVAYSWESFIGSFFEDYTMLSADTEGKEALNVWVSLGRDQAQIVKELVENDFMQKYDIPVSVSLVTGGVVEAALAGKGPDVALFVGGEFPVNLACRGLLADVSQFPDYDEVTGRFQENAMTPYCYGGGCYGLPISQTFPMMFYRTDVLSELGFTSPPETWDELRGMLPAIQRSYMNVGLVLPPANISPATEAGHTFAMLLLQRGQNYYNAEQTASSFDSIEAVQAFEEWTDLYTDYSFVQSYDAFSRFRTGEYPIVIANYTFFNQLKAASPEINGLWDFCQVPGTVRDDGTVSHAANSSGSGAIIFDKVKNKDDAWQFIKWFTETETQVRYAAQTEGTLGIMGRFDTANTGALAQLSWSEHEYERLAQQQSELVEIPVIPSSYAVTRNIMNAFREVVNDGENPRDTLMWYNRDINEEIARKRDELGLD